MKRNFCNTVTKRLISAFLVLAMVVTCIPVTDAEAKKKYQYKHDFYTVDGRKTDGHKEEIINTEHLEGCDYKDYPENECTYCEKYGLFNCYNCSWNTTKDMYAYGLNADEVKQLAAGKTVVIHVDRCRVLTICNSTNVNLKELFMEMSYTDKKRKRKDAKDFVEPLSDNGNVFKLNAGGSCPVITDVDITLRLPSKAVYNKYTRFELPKGDKGKKVTTYRTFVWHGQYNCNDSGVKICKENTTKISAAGLEEPAEVYMGKGKWKDWMDCELLFPRFKSLISNKGETFTLRGKYTHRKVTYRYIETDKKTGKLVYDKFKHESQLGVKDAK